MSINPLSTPIATFTQQDLLTPKIRDSRILIVDDDNFHNNVLRKWLAIEGYQFVDAITNGDELFRRLEQIDLLILDLNMPGLNGFTIISRLREFRANTFLPILVITGHQDRENRIRALAAGASDFLTKPIERDESKARIENLLTIRMLYRANQLERERYAALLGALLPDRIIRRLNDGQRQVADRAPLASVLFADLVGFTAVCATQPPETVVEIVGEIFGHFDKLISKTSAEKIKTVGDAYLAVGGLAGNTDHATEIAELALQFRDGVHDLPAAQRFNFNLRIGIHVGELVSGVLPGLRPAFDIWGDTVNTAARLQASGLPNTITVSEDMRVLLSPRFQTTDRGSLELKGKEPLRAHYLLRQE